MIDDPRALLAAARELSPWLVETRRDLHRHPELGLEEHRTSARVRAVLDELGIEHRDGLAGGTGVLGIVRGNGGGSGARVVALRADMDALPVQDAKDVPYRSQEAGKMHACGHDVHTTVLLGVAHLLAGIRQSLSGTVKLLFQPAEETVGGAERMIEEGVLRDPDTDAVFGLHVSPDLPVGSLGVGYGQRKAASDSIKLVIHGRSCHAAYPALGADALVAAAQVISAVQTVVSRNVDARDSAVISFGTVHGGRQANIMADRVELTGTVRTLDPEIRPRVLGRLRETVEGVAAALGTRAELQIEPGYTALVNDDAMVEVVRRTGERLLGAERVVVEKRPTLGVEDFAFFSAAVPGAFWSLGVANEARGIVHGLHQERFDVDEECLPIGVAAQTLNALTVLAG